MTHSMSKTHSVSMTYYAYNTTWQSEHKDCTYEIYNWFGTNMYDFQKYVNNTLSLSDLQELRDIIVYYKNTRPPYRKGKFYHARTQQLTREHVNKKLRYVQKKIQEAKIRLVWLKLRPNRNNWAASVGTSTGRVRSRVPNFQQVPRQKIQTRQRTAWDIMKHWDRSSQLQTIIDIWETDPPDNLSKEEIEEKINELKATLTLIKIRKSL